MWRHEIGLNNLISLFFLLPNLSFPSLLKRGENERDFISLFYFDMANINESDNSKFIKKIPSLAKRGRGDLAVLISEENK